MRRTPVPLLVLGLVLAGIPAAFAAVNDPGFAPAYAAANDPKLRDGLCGWHCVSPEYMEETSPLDWTIFDWDYFSIHDDDGEFTGAITYFNGDPRGVMSGESGGLHLMPSGQNIILYGQFLGQELSSTACFGLTNEPGDPPRVFGVDERSVYATGSGGRYGRAVPVRGTGGEPDRMLLSGRTDEYGYELTVRQMWAGTNGEPDYLSIKDDTWEVGEAMGGDGTLEHWTVNGVWETTKVDGWIKKLSTGEVAQIDGHGNRENSFGAWIWALGGWDFAYISDMATQVAWTFQTYHYKSDVLDFLDVQFMDNGTPKAVQFFAKDGELGWYHDQWWYDPVARKYSPRDLTVIAANDQYIVKARSEIGDNQVGLLMGEECGALPGLYCIHAHFPQISGEILRRGTCEVVATFSGQGGGEFSLMRNVTETPPAGQLATFDATFRHDVPDISGCYPCQDADGDGYGTLEGSAACPSPGFDCDDTDPLVHPGAAEVCGEATCSDGADNDCDLYSDGDDADCTEWCASSASASTTRGTTGGGALALLLLIPAGVLLVWRWVLNS